MFSEERKKLISEIVKSGQSVVVSELVQKFNVSESTIRRDLNELQEIGIITRTHGGAVGSINTNYEPSFIEKEDERKSEKLAIAKKAASLIEDNDTVIIDSGTTTRLMGQLITAKNITVVTNSIILASELSTRNEISIILTGGMIRPNTLAMVGPLAEESLQHFYADKAFIGANGISIQNGATTPNHVEASVKLKMINSSKESYLLCDSAKFGKVCFSKICSLNDFSNIITDYIISSDEIKKYESQGIKIIRSK